MSDSKYRKYGLHKDVPDDDVKNLAKRFRDSLPASEKNTRTGVFLGVEFLKELYHDLEAGAYDGIIVKIGKSKPVSRVSTYELVATALELKGGQSHDVVRRGLNYSSKGTDETHPPDVGSPPIDSATS